MRKKSAKAKESEAKPKETEANPKESEEQTPCVFPEKVPQNEWPSFPEYKKIDENSMLCLDAESKECKSLQCECKEKKRGLACGEECLNRLLLMECGDECRSGKYCTNKRFQNRQYADFEVFFTGPKGWGLRAKKDISPGQFIIEYIGEIINYKEMFKRIRRYGKDPNHKHHYLMALRNGTLIDATFFGNEARFINHSCEPNAATQKWTVGRQLRIGFFAIKTIRAGEEVTFNYQFERYGRKAQKCFCESPKCTGFIGGTKEDSGVDSNDDGECGVADESDISSDLFSSSDEEEKTNEAVVGSKSVDSKINTGAKSDLSAKKRGRPKKISSYLSSLDLNRSAIARLKEQGKHRHLRHHQRAGDTSIREQSEVNEILLRGPLRNRDQVLEFNRLMVRVDQMESRRRMVDFLLRIDDPNILRLFVANQGFALIRIWFVLPSFERRALQLQSQIARLLMRLPVTNKNQIDEVCIMSTLKQMLIFELPNKFVIKEKLANIVDIVVADVDGTTNQTSVISSKLGESQALAREFETLKILAAELADKWGKLVDWDFKIPKKLVDSVKESCGRDDKSRLNHEKHHHNRKDSVRPHDRENLNRNRGFDRQSIKSELGSSHKPMPNQMPQNWRYQRFQNHYRKFLPHNFPHKNNFTPPNFNHPNRFNGGRDDYIGEDGWDEEELRNFEEWKQFQRFKQARENDMFSSYFAMNNSDISNFFINGMRPPFPLPHPAQVAAAMLAMSGQPPPPVQLPLPPPPPQQQSSTPQPSQCQTDVDAQNSSQSVSKGVPPLTPSQSSDAQKSTLNDSQLLNVKTSPSSSINQQLENSNVDDTVESTIDIKSSITNSVNDTKAPPPPPSKEQQQLNKFINIARIKNKSKYREKDEIDKTASTMDDVRIPDLIVAVCSSEHNDDNNKTQDSDKTIKEEFVEENLDISTVQNEELKKQEPEKKNYSDRHIKTSKEVQAEMLQRRLKSLRAMLGDKTSLESHKPNEEVKDSSKVDCEPEVKQAEVKQSESNKTSSSKKTFSTTSSRTNSKSRSPVRDGRYSRRQNDIRDTRERRMSGERRPYYSSNRGERRPRRDDRFPRRGYRFDSRNGRNYRGGRRPSFQCWRQYNGNSRPYAVSPYRSGQNEKFDGDSDHERRKRSVHNEKSRTRESGDRLKRGDSAGIKAQLVKKAIDQQNKEDQENVLLSASEQRNRQRVQEAKKAEINTITEKLKTFIQPQEKEKELSFSNKKSSEHKRLLSNDSDASLSSDDDSSSTSSSSTSSDSMTTSSSLLAEVELTAKSQNLKRLHVGKKSVSDQNLSVNAKTSHHGSFYSKLQSISSITNKTEDDSPNCSIPSTSKGCFLPLQTITVSEQKIEEDTNIKCNTVKDEAEVEHDSSDELNSDDMMQPPKISVCILQDPPKLDAYIHQLKEFVYFMETMRRDMHGPPPLPLGLGANFLATQQGQQLCNLSVKQQNPSQLPASIIQNTSTSTKKLDLKRTHSNSQNQESSTSSPIKRVRLATTSNNEPNISHPTVSTPSTNIQLNKLIIESKNAVPQSQQNMEQFSVSNGEQPSHSSTPPEDPRCSNRDQTVLTMNTFVGQSENCDIPSQTISNESSDQTTNLTNNQQNDNQDSANPSNIVVDHNSDIASQTSSIAAVDPKTTSSLASTSKANLTLLDAKATPTSVTTTASNPSPAVHLVTKSGLWLVAKDTDGTPYFYHRDTRETSWDLPEGEELIDLNAVAPSNEATFLNSLVMQHRRAEFKRQVSALVAKCIESYRKRFFPNPNDYSSFLRKITHKVLDSQEGNKELLFNIQVQKNTRRLVDDYIKHFKGRESGTFN